VSGRSIQFAAPDLGDEEYPLVKEVLRSGLLSHGPMLEGLEREFAERFGSRHAIAVTSGTAAVHLSILAAGVGDGDLVITTPFSFIASANPLLYERAIPVFVDIDPETLAIDPARAADAIEMLTSRRHGWERLLPPDVRSRNGKLRAIIPVDVFGRVADMQQIVDSARAAGIAVIEDACEAVGASRDGVFAGRWGDAGTFGFHTNKQMTSGEGGLVLTDHDSWALAIRSIRSQGRSDDGSWLRHQRLGYNYRLDELRAAVALAQFRRLDEMLRKRSAIAAMYDERLRGMDDVTPLPPPRRGSTISWFLYVVRVNNGGNRDELARDLAARGVPTRPYFWPIHLQPPYQERFGFERGSYPHSEAAGDSLLALPFHGNLTEDDIDYVCEAIAAVPRMVRAKSR
jgi:perosamine synthetase